MASTTPSGSSNPSYNNNNSNSNRAGNGSSYNNNSTNSQQQYIPTKLYVTNFPYTCTQRQINDLFGQYGPVVECTLKKDYYAYVQYVSNKSAVRAYKLANGQLKIAGRKLTVHLATSRKSQSHLSTQQLLATLQIDLDALSLAELTASSPPSNGNGGSLNLDVLPRIVHVRNFPEQCSQEQVRAAFAAYGEITECLILHDSYAFVHFRVAQDARSALQATNNQMLLGSTQQPLLVQYSRSKFKQQSSMGETGGGAASSSAAYAPSHHRTGNVNSRTGGGSYRRGATQDGEVAGNDDDYLNDDEYDDMENNYYDDDEENTNNGRHHGSNNHHHNPHHHNHNDDDEDRDDYDDEDEDDEEVDENDEYYDSRQSSASHHYTSGNNNRNFYNNGSYQQGGYGNNNNSNYGGYGKMGDKNAQDMDGQQQQQGQHPMVNAQGQQLTSQGYVAVRTKLYITNFPEEMDQEEMKQLFNQYGHVLECTIMWNQYAFVHFGSYEEAEKAIIATKGKHLAT
jgi:RNA recognition motif-containing protein